MPGRPAIRREAALRNLAVLRAAAASSRETIYSNLGLIERPQGAGTGNYATSAAQFRAGLPEISNYSPVPSAPTASTGTFSSLRFNSLDTLPTMPLVQNAAGGN